MEITQIITDLGSIDVGGKQLRRGYTTGTCAAGAAAAAAYMALHRELVQQVQVQLPGLAQGQLLQLPLAEARLEADGALAAITKDGGDDPDVTHGLNIVAQVRLTPGSGRVQIEGGQGVGRVTLAGLKIPVGEAAINPVPRAMIVQNVQAQLPPGWDAEVLISAPGGEELASRTFNPRLGIVGGLSILGSTGIVNPMSEAALQESLRLELHVLAGRGYQAAILAFGNYGLQFLRSQRIDETQVVKISNYLGFMLDEARQLGFRRLLLIGHLGKLVKVSAGIFNTHSRVADGRLETLTAYAALAGAGQPLLAQLYQCTTTSAAAALLEQDGGGLAERVYQQVAERAASRAALYGYGELEIATILFGDDNRLLYKQPQADQFLKELKHNDE